MKKFLKTSTLYLSAIMPLVAVAAIFTFEKSPVNFDRAQLTDPSIGNAAGLPCGFVAKGPRQHPQKPTFISNNYIPILQFPAGNFAGTTTQVDNSIYSEGKNDQLVLQEDGNLVIYCVSCNPAKAIWSSQTNGKDARTLFFQTDGDLVLRDSNNKTVWHSNIISKCAGSELAYFALQDDGNLLMLYDDYSQTPADANGTDNALVTCFLGGSGSTNSQAKMSHPGKIN